MRTHPGLTLGLLLAALAATPARGADPAGDARLRDALRSTTSQLRALEEEQARGQAREAQLQREVASLKAELAEARRTAAAAGEGRALRRQLTEQAEVTARAAEGIAQCRQELAAEAARLRQAEEARGAAAGRLDELAARAGACEARAARSREAGQAFAAWLARPGALCEPIFGLRRVELENKVQALQDQLADPPAAAAR